MNNEIERLTFKDKYLSCKTWQDKAIVVGLYHTIMCIKYPSWTVLDTALHFEISVGLTSENIRLAEQINSGNESINKSASREAALKLIERRSYPKRD